MWLQSYRIPRIPSHHASDVLWVWSLFSAAFAPTSRRALQLNKASHNIFWRHKKFQNIPMFTDGPSCNSLHEHFLHKTALGINFWGKKHSWTDNYVHHDVFQKDENFKNLPRLAKGVAVTHSMNISAQKQHWESISGVNNIIVDNHCDVFWKNKNSKIFPNFCKWALP